MTSTGGPEVVVVGSVNLDLSIDIDRFPEPGETITGLGQRRGGGGKGANQAVAAARLGRRVALLGRVGDDADGRGLRQALLEEGIDTSTVLVTEEAPTGLAVIEVDATGENRIVVLPGANGQVSIDDLDRWSSLIARAGVILTQLEIPVPVVAELLRRPRTGRLLLTPAPVAPIDLSGVDVLVPNRGELARLAGAEPATTLDEVADQVAGLDPAPAEVVVTMGGQGSVVATGLRQGARSLVEVPAEPVAVVDTTGAGDAFSGGLADALHRGADLVDAARWATRVAAVAVTRPGAWGALPTRAELAEER